MKAIKTIFLALFLFSVYNISCAGDLASKEAENYYKEGVKLQQRGDFREAEINYQKVLIVDPFNSTWQKYIINNRGVMYGQMGDLRMAEQLFNEALAIDPGYETAKLNLGFIYEGRRSELESLKYWIGVLKIDLDSIKPKGFVVEEPKEPKK